MISVITCSIDEIKKDRFLTSVTHAFPSDTEIIVIDDARSLTEGFNRGLDQAKGDILVLCHDDIEFVNHNMGAILQRDLAKTDIVGVAGTSYLQDGGWFSAGYPHSHGHITELRETGEYVHSLFGLGCDGQWVENIVAMDGLFMATRRDVIEAHRYDEDTFDGWHLYDIDFTFGAYLKGFRLAIDYDIHIIHASGGDYGSAWESYKQRFGAKYYDYLSSPRQPALKHSRGALINRRDLVGSVMRHHKKYNRLNLYNQDALPPFKNTNNTTEISTSSIAVLRVHHLLDETRDLISSFNEWWRLLENNGYLCLSFPENLQWSRQNLSKFAINSGDDDSLRRHGYLGTFVLNDMGDVFKDGQRQITAILTGIKQEKEVADARAYFRYHLNKG